MIARIVHVTMFLTIIKQVKAETIYLPTVTREAPYTSIVYHTVNHIDNGPVNQPMHMGTDPGQCSALPLTYKLAGSALAGYSYTVYQMISKALLLKRRYRWSEWKITIPTEKLLESDVAQLGKNLWKAVEKKYNKTHKLKDALMLYLNLINDVDHEIELLRSLGRMHQKIAFWKMRLLFPRQRALITTIPSKLQRLEYIKLLAHAWVQKIVIADRGL